LSSRLLPENVKIIICKSVILADVLYRCELLSVALRDEHSLGTFENRVLGGIYGPKKDGITGDWRKLLNEELYNVYCGQGKEDEMGGACSRHGGEMKNLYKILVGKPGGKVLSKDTLVGGGIILKWLLEN
jgi:hypothetical protein